MGIINIQFLEKFLYNADDLNDEGEVVDMFMGSFVVDCYKTYRGICLLKISDPSMYYICVYYLHTSNTSKLLNLKKKIKKDLSFFLILTNKIHKLKYTLLNEVQETIITMSLGMISGYFEQKQKSLKKSSKMFVVFIKFIKKTLLKIVKKKKYIFILRGLNKRIFKFLNFFNFTFKNSTMGVFILKPLYSFNKIIFKKIKSIKRKLQKKNVLKINDIYKNLRFHSIKNFTI